MKHFPFIIALSLSSCVPSYAAYLPDSSKAKILHAVAVLQEDNKVVRQNLHDANEALAASEAETKTIQIAADKLKGERDWYRDQCAEKDALITAKDRLIASKNHKLDELGWMLAISAALVVFLWSGQLVPYIAAAYSPYSLGGRIGLSIVTFGVVFSWVRYF